MIVLATPVPVQLTPQQGRIILGLVGILLVTIVVGALFGSILGGLSSLVLRITGHRPPQKSSLRTKLDELEDRLREK